MITGATMIAKTRVQKRRVKQTRGGKLIFSQASHFLFLFVFSVRSLSVAFADDYECVRDVLVLFDVRYSLCSCVTQFTDVFRSVSINSKEILVLDFLKLHSRQIRGTRLPL